MLDNIKTNRKIFGLIARKQRWRLTWRGWIVACIIVVSGLIWSVANVYQFLAINAPVHGDILVVEGWLPDNALKRAVSEFYRHDYKLLVTTGGPLERGSFLIKYKTYAQIAKSTMLKLGVDPRQIVAVPSPRVRKDRTYASALALKKWLKTSRITIRSLNILSLGPHARRSWLLFKKALGSKISVGVIAVKDTSYNPNRWWISSAGVRSVIGETIAYIYARFFFIIFQG